MVKDYYQEAIKLIQSRKYLTLATIAEDNQPYAHTLGYVSKWEILYFATDKNTQKVKNITANSKVGYTINMDEDTDWDEIQGLQIIGNASIVTGSEEIKQVHEMLFAKFPYLKELPQDEKHAENMVMIRIEPTRGRFLDNTVHFGYSIELVY